MVRASSTPVAAKQSATDGFTVRFDASWSGLRERHRRLLKMCRRRPSAGNVHDLRTATRRLQSHLELLDIAAPSPAEQLRKPQNRLKRLRHATSAARDAQVLRSLVRRLAGRKRQPGLKRLDDYAQKRARRLAAALAEELRHHHPRLRRLRIHDRLAGLAAGRFRVLAVRALDREWSRAERLLGRTRPDDSDALHAARLAIKRLLDLAELVRPERSASVRPLRAVLAAIGDARDFDQLLRRIARRATLDRRIEAWRRSEAVALQRRQRALNDRCRRVMAAGIRRSSFAQRLPNSGQRDRRRTAKVGRKLKKNLN